MLKLMVLLECDRCGDSLRKVAISSDRNPDAWNYLSGELEFKATENKWNVDSQHLCYFCLLEPYEDFGSTSEQNVTVNSDIPF